MIGWFIRGAMDLTWTIEYAVQAGRALIISFIWFLPLTEFAATESGVDGRVIGIITVASTLMSVASELAVAISGLRSVRFACIVTIASTLMPVAAGLAVAILGFRGARFTCIIIATG